MRRNASKGLPRPLDLEPRGPLFSGGEENGRLGLTPAPRLVVYVVSVLLLSLALRAALFSTGLALHYPDERDYIRIAQSIAANGEFDGGPELKWPEEFRAPLLPYLLAGSFRLGFSLDGARWLTGLANSMFPVALLLAGYLLTRRTVWATLAAGWGVLHPFQARSSFELTTDALTATVMAFAVLLLLAGGRLEKRTYWTVPLCGLLLGIAACLRSNMLLFILPVVCYWSWQSLQVKTTRRSYRPLFLGLAGVAIVIAPFVALRSLQEGRLLLLTDAGSEILWRGNSTFSRDYLDGTRTPEQYVQDYHDIVRYDWGTARAAQRSVAAARDYIMSEPAEWARLKFRMLFETWRPWPSFQEDEGVATLGRVARLAVALLKIAWYLLTFALLVRAVVRYPAVARSDPAATVLLAWLGISTLFGTALSPDPRYRMASDVALVLLNIPWEASKQSRVSSASKPRQV